MTPTRKLKERQDQQLDNLLNADKHANLDLWIQLERIAVSKEKPGQTGEAKNGGSTRLPGTNDN